MAIQSETCSVTYSGNNSTEVAYVVPFLFFKQEHLEVVAIDGDGVETELSLTTDFTVTGEGDEDGGTLTTVAAWDGSHTITINRVLPETQPFVYSEGQRLPMKTLEKNFDWIVMIFQGANHYLTTAINVINGVLDNLTLPWSSITGKPSTFTPSEHTHSFGSITGKPSSYPPTIGSTSDTAVAGNDSRFADVSAATSDASDVGTPGKLLKSTEGGTITIQGLTVKQSSYQISIAADSISGTDGVSNWVIQTAGGGTYTTPTGSGTLALTPNADGSVSYNDLVDVPTTVPLTSSKVVANAAARLALTTEQAEGFAVVDADTGKTWMLVAGGTPATSSDWLQLGDRDITAADITDLEKYVSPRAILPLKNTRAKLNTRSSTSANPINVLVWGDSISTGLDSSDFQAIPLESFAGYKLAGWNTVNSGTVTPILDGGANWLGPDYYRHAVGSTSTWKYNNTTALVADKIGVGYLAGTGSFALQYNIGGAGWVTAGTINTASGAGYTEYTISNPNSLTVEVRVTSVTTAAVDILGVGYWKSSSGGMTLSLCNLSGIVLTNVAATEATISAVIGGINPDIVLMSWSDPLAVFQTGGNFRTLKTRFEAGYHAIDWVFVSPNPAREDASLHVQLHNYLREWALSERQNWIDGQTFLVDWDTGTDLGFLNDAQNPGVHLTEAGKTARQHVVREAFREWWPNNGGSIAPISQAASFSHSGTSSGPVVLGGSHGGLLLTQRASGSTNKIGLQSQSSEFGSDRIEMYATGKNSTADTTFVMKDNAANEALMTWTRSGDVTTGYERISSAFPLQISFKASSADPSNTPSGYGRLYIYNNAGKIELRMSTPSGPVVVKAEP